MKVVINNCFGGFGLSAKAVLEYAKLSGFKVFAYKSHEDDFKLIVRCHEPNDEFVVYWIRTDIGENPTEDQLNNAEWLHERDIKRDDENLIKVVEKLGAKANGSYASLKIVEIPDGVDYEICDYDGNEHIAETHRTWS